MNVQLGRQSKPFKDPITHRHIHKGSSFLLVRELTQREIMILRGTKVNKENLTIESVQKQLSLNSEVCDRIFLVNTGPILRHWAKTNREVLGSA